MTADPAHSPTIPADPIGATPAQRRRFAVALGVFGLWVAALALLATRAEPPDPTPETNPGAAPPSAVPDGAADEDDRPR
ncbi:hypothetical protein [Tautonia sociabilis]|uniref:Uncharacterized protein n=1 Tax=Tautonia sociabilis TaxID=2080755 RepID=A0A432MRF4_9BACT|nr:hypothetical protein [Tautonia sociabilis]RUL89597.1 hypothetical protein TsocGM_00030 [Tautonia sociabilis]